MKDRGVVPVALVATVGISATRDLLWKGSAGSDKGPSVNSRGTRA